MGLFDLFRRGKAPGGSGGDAPPGLTALPGGFVSIPEPTGDLVDDLARLAQLKTSGALTDEEFEAAKSKLLGSDPPPSEPPPAA